VLHQTILGGAVLLAVLCALLFYRLAVLKRKHTRTRAELLLAREEQAARDAEITRLNADLQRMLQYDSVLFNNARDMVFFHGVTADGLPGCFSRVNDVACAMLEMTREKLMTLTPLDVEAFEKSSMVRMYSRTELVMLSEADLRYRETTSVRQLVSHILSSDEVQYERVFIAASGKRIPVEITARKFDLQGRPQILLIAHDATRRVTSERALREGRSRLRDLLAHSPVGLAIYSHDRKLLDVNLACMRILGIPGQAEFHAFDPFSSYFVPADIRERLLRGDSSRYEAAIDFEDVLKSGLFITGRTGRAYVEVIITNLGVDEDYNPKGYLVEIQDITRKREAEGSLRRMERQLRQAQKMEAIGSLSGGIAHDFNNILTPLLGYTEMLLEMLPGEDTSHEYAAEILKACGRAKELVNQILTFSRQADHASAPIKLAPIVKEVVKLVRGSTPENIDISYVNKADHDTVVSDPTRVHQVLMNLCTNAVHAMKDMGGSLEIRMTNFNIEHRSRSEFPQLSPGSYVRLSVRDTGCGMEPAVADRIFEPFFTTKPSGEGTGMGLAVVHGIVTAMNGAITVESAPGKGATFHVALPVHARLAEERKISTAPVPRGTEKILFIDDEADILTMLARMLASLGYTVSTDADPVNAFARFARNPREFDLVITDQVMPGLRGDELARRMLEIRPDLPIVLTTGFSETITAPQAKELGVREFVMKPIVTRDIAEAIRRALD